MQNIDVNVLAFVWLGAFFVINIGVALAIVLAAKRRKTLPNMAGAVVISSAVALAVCSLFFIKDLGVSSAWELCLILGAAVMLMLWEYFIPKTSSNVRGEMIFIGAVMLGSMALLPAGADFARVGAPSLLVAALAFLGWVWLMVAFKKMSVVPRVCLSQGAFLGFALFAGAMFFAMKGQGSLLAVGVVGAAVMVALLGFKNWSRNGAWPELDSAAIMPVCLVLGWGLMKFSAAGLWCFALVVPLFFLLESLYMAVKKYIFKDGGALAFTIRALAEGAPPVLVLRAFLKTNLVLLMIGILSFPKSYQGVLLGIAVLMVIYQQYRFWKWQQKQPTIREVTKGLFHEVKQGYAEQKSFYTKLFGNLKKKDNLKDALALTGEQMAREDKLANEPKAKPKAKALESVKKTKAKKQKVKAKKG